MVAVGAVPFVFFSFPRILVGLVFGELSQVISRTDLAGDVGASCAGLYGPGE